MSDFRWGLIGPGGIAHRFAQAVQALPGAHLAAVLGRQPDKAAAFAAQWQVAGKPAPRVAADFDALLGAGALDAVYIATPHSAHGEWVRACLQAGMPVLCEKPLVPHHALGRELVDLASQRQVFLMEALWTRYLPVYELIHAWLASGAIGRLQTIQSSFCFPAQAGPQSRLYNPALAGGALLDIGIYNLSMSRWAVQAATGQVAEPIDMDIDGVLADTGVDARVTATLRFPHAVQAQFVCGFDGAAPNSLALFGSAGTIVVPQHFWEGTQAVLTRSGQPPEVHDRPFAINGFEYEIAEAMRCIREGRLESPRLPHAETLATLACMDEIRRRLGVRYPFELAP
jgi:predicted dehydrogenase